MARQYEVIAIEPLDLAKAAIKIDPTGEKTDLNKKARAGRVVAAIYELESAIRWTAIKTGAAVVELAGKTASTCSVCGSVHVVPDEGDSQVLNCHGCGAVLDRKRNGAAVAWQLVMPQREDIAYAYHSGAIEARRLAQEKKSGKLGKMAAARRVVQENTAILQDADA